MARHIDRRWMLKGVVSLEGGIAAPALLKSTSAQPSALRIGVPTAITGNWALPAVQIQRTCRLYAKYINSHGGIDGRQINFVQAKLVRSQRMRTGLWVLSSPRFRVAPLPQYATAKSTRSVLPACVLRIACTNPRQELLIRYRTRSRRIDY